MPKVFMTNSLSSLETHVAIRSTHAVHTTKCKYFFFTYLHAYCTQVTIASNKPTQHSQHSPFWSGEYNHRTTEHWVLLFLNQPSECIWIRSLYELLSVLKTYVLSSRFGFGSWTGKSSYQSDEKNWTLCRQKKRILPHVAEWLNIGSKTD
jgi:hypothetical protein